MSRVVYISLAAIGFAALAIGCWNSRDGESSGTDTPKTTQAATPKALLEGWPTPAAVLVLTGNQHGYLEPCGCSDKQSGGVARRADLFRQLRARDLPVAGLDVGGSIEKSRKQTQLKFISILDAYRQLGYRGLGLGPEELRLGAAFLLTQNTAAPDGADGPAMLAANVTFFDTPDLPGGPGRVQIFEIGGVKVGVVAVLGESNQRDIVPAGSASGLAFAPPAAVLPTLVQELTAAGTRFNILLVEADLDESKALAQQFPQFQAVVTAGGSEDPDGAPILVGNSQVLALGHKGKHAGVLGLFPDDKTNPLRFELVDLNRDAFRHDTRMDAVMAEYQQMLRDNLSEVFADLPEGFPPTPGTYVGAAKCGECHTKAYAKWKTTRHAQAYQSLAHGRTNFEGTWTPRLHDPECLACHVVGWNPQEEYPYSSGFLPEEIAAERGKPQQFTALQGQQCENCHGPGSGHVAVFEKWKANPQSVPQAEQAAAVQQVKVSLATAEQTTCIKCHDYENSPHFDFKTYWEKVRHPGRD